MDATLLTVGTGSYSIIPSTSSPTGTNYLSLIGGSSTNGGYMQLPTFTFGGGGWSVCFWYNKAASTINESAARIFDFSTAVAGVIGLDYFF